MNRSTVRPLAWMLIAVLAPVPGTFAQATVDPKTGFHRIDGTVIAINKENSTIRIRQKNRNNIVVTVSYTSDTKFSQLSEPATLTLAGAAEVARAAGAAGYEVASRRRG